MTPLRLVAVIVIAAIAFVLTMTLTTQVLRSGTTSSERAGAVVNQTKASADAPDGQTAAGQASARPDASLVDDTSPRAVAREYLMKTIKTEPRITVSVAERLIALSREKGAAESLALARMGEIVGQGMAIDDDARKLIRDRLYEALVDSNYRMQRMALAGAYLGNFHTADEELLRRMRSLKTSPDATTADFARGYFPD
jgi:hypothetical protein